MASHETLKAWQHARRLAKACRSAAKRFPPDEHRLSDQLRGAADSVVLNIAEGSAKGTNKDFRESLETARGSMKEVEAALALAFDGDLIAESVRPAIEAVRDETARTLYGLLRSVAARVENGEQERFHRPGHVTEGALPPP